MKMIFLLLSLVFTSTSFSQYSSKSNGFFNQNKCTDFSITLLFSPQSIILTDTAKIQLKNVALWIDGHPTCKFIIGSCCKGSKEDNQLAWNRVNKVMQYLIQKLGIAETSISFGYDIAIEPNTIVIQAR